MPSMQSGNATGVDGGGVVPAENLPDITIKTVSSFPYTLLESDFDGNTLIRCDSASAHVVTLPPDLVVAKPVFICQVNTGQTTLELGSGVTCLSKSGLLISDQNAGFALVPTASNAYHLFGDMVDA